MKILGLKNKTHFIASVARHDCRVFDGMMVDGGVPGLENGYSRFSDGEQVWAEVKQNYAELYSDYQFNDPRCFGVWPLEEVRILAPEEYPDVESVEWRAANLCWGTRGKNGDEPLTYKLMKDLDEDHLKVILETQRISDERRETIEYLLK